jgi:hypothetical protein
VNLNNLFQKVRNLGFTWMTLLLLVLRGFELASGLKVNFFKISLIGLNFEPRFLVSASRLLKCRLGRPPFTYLSIPIGACPRKMETWKPIIDSYKKKLNNRRKRSLTTCGKVVLINSVLTSLLLYFFSIFKAPKKLLKVLIRLQRYFL